MIRNGGHTYWLGLVPRDGKNLTFRSSHFVKRSSVHDLRDFFDGTSSPSTASLNWGLANGPESDLVPRFFGRRIGSDNGQPVETEPALQTGAGR